MFWGMFVLSYYIFQASNSRKSKQVLITLASSEKSGFCERKKHLPRFLVSFGTVYDVVAVRIWRHRQKQAEGVDGGSTTDLKMGWIQWLRRAWEFGRFEIQWLDISLRIQSQNVRWWARGLSSPPKRKVFRFHETILRRWLDPEGFEVFRHGFNICGRNVFSGHILSHPITERVWNLKLEVFPYTRWGFYQLYTVTSWLKAWWFDKLTQTLGLVWWPLTARIQVW